MKIVNLHCLLLLFTLILAIHLARTENNNLNDASYQNFERILKQQVDKEVENEDYDTYKPEKLAYTENSGESKQMGTFLNNLHKHLMKYVHRRDNIVPKGELVTAANIESQKSEKKEKKKTNRLPFKWGR